MAFTFVPGLSNVPLAERVIPAVLSFSTITVLARFAIWRLTRCCQFLRLGRVPRLCRHTDGLTETLSPSDGRLQAGHCPAHLRILGSQVSKLFGREPRAG